MYCIVLNLFISLHRNNQTTTYKISRPFIKSEKFNVEPNLETLAQPLLTIV